MRVAFEIDAVLEGTGLSLIDIHRHEAGSGFATHDAPLAPSWKTRATQAAQPRIFHRFNDAFYVPSMLNTVA